MEIFSEEEREAVTDRLVLCHSELASLLSPFVQEIIQESKSDLTEEVLTADGFLDWERVYGILDEAGYVKESPCYKDIIKSLSPSVNSIFNVYKNISLKQFWETYEEYFMWTGNKELFIHILDHMQDKDSNVSVVLSMLLLTSGIERALASVYLIKGKSLPFLLKDLLSTTELEEIFGEKEMALINMFLGIPTSLNLRNILWHGFVSPSEIDQRYGYFLIVLTMTLGLKLQISDIKDIPFRAYVSFDRTCVLQGVFADVSEEEVMELKNIFLNSCAIPSCSSSYWKVLLDLYEQKLYGDCMALLLPQLETCLRMIFASANNCSSRVLTAEPDTRYVTLTEIFSELLEDGKPNLFSRLFAESEMELLLDVFVHPEGPRVRDRLSHGEVDFFHIPQHLVKHVLCIAGVVCLKFVDQQRELLERQLHHKLKLCALSYQSFYHPVPLLKERVMLFVQDLMKWDVGQVHSAEVCDIDEELCPEHFQECIALMQTVFELPSSFCSRWNSFSEGLTEFDVYLKTCRISTVYRPKIEGEIIVILRKISYHSLEASSNVQLALTTYHAFWKDKALRSRQRSTYARLLKSVAEIPTTEPKWRDSSRRICLSGKNPVRLLKHTLWMSVSNCVFIIYAGLRMLLIIIVGHILNVNNISRWEDEKKNVMFKILKLAQKYVENLDVMSGTKVNRWEESSKSTSNFVEKLSNFLKQLEQRTFSS